jgi:hypothetical protein
MLVFSFSMLADDTSFVLLRGDSSYRGERKTEHRGARWFAFAAIGKLIREGCEE